MAAVVGGAIIFVLPRHGHPSIEISNISAAIADGVFRSKYLSNLSFNVILKLACVYLVHSASALAIISLQCLLDVRHLSHHLLHLVAHLLIFLLSFFVAFVLIIDHVDRREDLASAFQNFLQRRLIVFQGAALILLTLVEGDELTIVLRVHLDVCVCLMVVVLVA